MFRIGQKVVCVDAVPRYARINDPSWPLQEGTIYTVRGVSTEPIGHEPTLLLVEVHEITKLDSGYYATRFRPLVERKTDISIFVKMLDPQKHTELT